MLRRVSVSPMQISDGEGKEGERDQSILGPWCPLFPPAHSPRNSDVNGALLWDPKSGFQCQLSVSFEQVVSPLWASLSVGVNQDDIVALLSPPRLTTFLLYGQMCKCSVDGTSGPEADVGCLQRLLPPQLPAQCVAYPAAASHSQIPKLSRNFYLLPSGSTWPTWTPRTPRTPWSYGEHQRCKLEWGGRQGGRLSWGPGWPPLELGFRVASLLVFSFLQAVFPIPARPHCKTPVSNVQLCLQQRAKHGCQLKETDQSCLGCLPSLDVQLWYLLATHGPLNV